MVKKVGITIGDPAGIGPEITLKSLAESVPDGYQYIVYANENILEFYKDKLGMDLVIHKMADLDDYIPGKVNVNEIGDFKMEGFEPGKLSFECGDAAYRYVAAAIRDALDEKIQAVVTGPLNKEALQGAGHHYAGHTEIFADLTNTQNYAMMFSGPVNIIHVSTHVPLRVACDLVKKERVLNVIKMADEAMKRKGFEKPRVVVSGLNPHAGESGLFGDEEINEVIPAIEEARKLGIDVYGPVPGDDVFIKLKNNQYDIAVAMFHDQGHIPAKLNWRDTCVNVTVGLPIIRTSVDHGTAFDIVLTGQASNENLDCAIKEARDFIG